MQIYFTKEEQQYIIINKDKVDYCLACREDAPDKIRKSIVGKITAHKRWLKNGGIK